MAYSTPVSELDDPTAAGSMILCASLQTVAVAAALRSLAAARGRPLGEVVAAAEADRLADVVRLPTIPAAERVLCRTALVRLAEIEG